MHHITELYWRVDRVEHIARHNVAPEEFEEALFDDEHGLLSCGEVARRDPQERLYSTWGVPGLGGIYSS